MSTLTILTLAFLWTLVMGIAIAVIIYIYRDIKKHFIENESKLIELRKIIRP